MGSKTRKTRIIVSVEAEGLQFVVHRKGRKSDWRGTLNVSPIPDITPPATFPTEERAIEFADEIVKRLIEHDGFRECPDSPDDEFPH